MNPVNDKYLSNEYVERERALFWLARQMMHETMLDHYRKEHYRKQYKTMTKTQDTRREPKETFPRPKIRERLQRFRVVVLAQGACIQATNPTRTA